ncbi:hypothetical protein HAX54_050595 [Datura stramonium]|uniref:Uncharacterized protein n=1 Tax=Datura stramonium TaxID=4076 RepID=A0ABS8WPF0_DATST|nr:hypothetical protein [Datura stramonium]
MTHRTLLQTMITSHTKKQKAQISNVHLRPLVRTIPSRYHDNQEKSNEKGPRQGGKAEIAARRALRDEASTSEQNKDTPSGSVEEYEVDKNDIEEPHTTRAQAISSLAPPAKSPQSEKKKELRSSLRSPDLRRSIKEELQVLTNALNEVEEMKKLFDFYGFEWMARTPDSYSANMVRKFYTNNLATLEQRTQAGRKVRISPY